MRKRTEQPELFSAGQTQRPLHLKVILDVPEACILLQWFSKTAPGLVAAVRVRCTGANQLTFQPELPPGIPPQHCPITPRAIHTSLAAYRRSYPFNPDTFECGEYRVSTRGNRVWKKLSVPPDLSPWEWVEERVLEMGEVLSLQFESPPPAFDEFELPDFNRLVRRDERKRERAEEELARRRELLREQQKRREEKRRQEEARRKSARHEQKLSALAAPTPTRLPLPPVPVSLQEPILRLQDPSLAAPDLRAYFLRERAAHWWVSNQPDDLLSLPYCKIERLDYQLRTALRAMGPLHGRALLSDEVGLGKTVEAGLVMKEYLTRGMIKRFLVLTVPSLVDQWEEELSDKFQINAVTTNQAAFRANSAAFWQENPAIIASLHTLKQPAHLAVAQSVKWDMLVVDEAHYLRNRSSQAWQAVNALPRQFLLLLTATPVQNSIEELYNLVTLLQPGQLPSPKEFRARYIDPKRPSQPRQPEELRRLLGQVMIRNTRANAGIKLPPRRAETVLFEPPAQERQYWQAWEGQLREALASLPASQASLWGRLLLQAAGSSPGAWKEALKAFPNQPAASAWTQEAALSATWKKKCALLLPLTKAEGGVVLFTQFLQTQLDLAHELRAAAIPAWVINGQTPPAQRQPITESFHREGGVLLLTHSGTEGRNLQFSHHLVNFDLPWNPMEIEQRIGRLHRIGQKHPVRIYSFVQAGTLQEHLLEVLQEKLNLFELVVGETGLILGDRFSSDEFAEEVFRRWRDSHGRVAESLHALGEELAAARADYDQVKQLDETLFAHDYESS